MLWSEFRYFVAFFNMIVGIQICSAIIEYHSVDLSRAAKKLSLLLLLF